MSDEKKHDTNVGSGVAYDKNGAELKVGDLYRAPDGHVYRVNGLTVESKPGTNAQYSRDVVKVPADTPWTDSAGGLSPQPQSIIWGS